MFNLKCSCCLNNPVIQVLPLFSVMCATACFLWCVLLSVFNDVCYCLFSVMCATACFLWCVLLPVFNDVCYCLFSVMCATVYFQWCVLLSVFNDVCYCMFSLICATACMQLIDNFIHSPMLGWKDDPAFTYRVTS